MGNLDGARTSGWIWATLTIGAWASSFPAIRAALEAFGAVDLASLRFALAAVPAAVILMLRRPRLPTGMDCLRLFFGGVSYVALYSILLNLGEQTVSAGAASFIINTHPILTALLSVVFLGDRIGWRSWIGAGVAFAGVGLLSLGSAADADVVTGALLIFGAAVTMSLATIVQKPLLARMSGLDVGFFNIVIGAVLLAPFGLATGLSALDTASSHAIFALIYLALVPGLVAYATWPMVLSRLPAAQAANLLFLVPPVAVLLSFLWLGERPGLLTLVGGAVTLGGVVLANWRAQPSR